MKKAMLIKEQVINDPVSGLVIEFKVRKSGKGMELYLHKNAEEILSHGNRDFYFEEDGSLGGAGTSLVPLPIPKEKTDSTINDFLDEEQS